MGGRVLCVSTILGKSYWPHGSTTGSSWVWHIDPILSHVHPQITNSCRETSFWKKCIFCAVFDTAPAFQPSWSHSSRNLPLLVSPPIAVIGPHICAGFTSIRAVPGGHHDHHDHDFLTTYWMSRHLPDCLLTIVSPTKSHFCQATPEQLYSSTCGNFEQEFWTRSSATLFLARNTGATVHCTV